VTDGENAAATDEAERAALADAAASGIHAIAVPTPFLVGRVNCYLIEDDPLTLVDTGPNSGKSLDELAGISGVGAKKLDAYGEDILRVLKSDAAM